MQVWKLSAMAKIGTAVGARDDAEVARVIKMTAAGAVVAGVLPWILYSSAGPWLLESVYDTSPAEYPWAMSYLRVCALGA
jgi:Na+-driven multidrug efflux pump